GWRERLDGRAGDAGRRERGRAGGGLVRAGALGPEAECTAVPGGVGDEHGPRSYQGPLTFPDVTAVTRVPPVTGDGRLARLGAFSRGDRQAAETPRRREAETQQEGRRGRVRTGRGRGRGRDDQAGPSQDERPERPDAARADR